MRSCKMVALLALLAVGTLVCIQSSWAQVKKGKTRAAATRYLMRGVVQPNCAGLGKLLEGTGPADDKAWDTATCHASCLNEVSFLLMDDGRCPDGVWAEAAKTTLREGTAEILAACEKKDAAAASAAFKKTTQACASCHKAHKGK